MTGEYLSFVWVAGKTLCDPSLTRAIPECFSDEYCTCYKPLYECCLLLLYFSGQEVAEPVKTEFQQCLGLDGACLEGGKKSPQTQQN